MKEIGIRANISASAVARILDHMRYSCDSLPEVISIDEFRKFIHSPYVHTVKKRLSDWYMHVGTTDSKEFERFHKCVETFSKWESEILNAFESGLSNGYTEGCNNKIKVIKRNAYGIRNFKRLRKRIPHVTAW